MKIPIDSVQVGTRVRKALGDLDELVRDLSADGLIQPITVRPDHILVCGQRRLEAAKRLGWTHIEALVKKVDAEGEDAEIAYLRAELEENRNREGFRGAMP